MLARGGIRGTKMAFSRSRAKVRVYHFVDRDYGLDDLRRRRLKIATVANLNDPFELLPSSTDKALRARFRAWRMQFDQAFGILCFSRHWRNPVQWSHYAVKHTGLCFGFDIPANLLTKVRYAANRLPARVDVIEGGGFEAQKEILTVARRNPIKMPYKPLIYLSVFDSHNFHYGIVPARFT